MLLKEFEHSPAVIEPFGHGQVEEFGVCDTLIFSFNGEIVDRVRQMPESREGGYLKSLNGRHPWYLLEKDGLEVAVMMAGIGAPLAVGHLEELKSSGFKNFIILGSCGVLDESIEADKIILPSSALRDEGTSYHYAPASDEISYEPALLLTMEKALNTTGIEHVRARPGPQMPFIGKQPIRSNAAWRLEPPLWIWRLPPSWPGPNSARPRFISFSTQQTTWTTTKTNGMPAMGNGPLIV